MYAYRLSMRQLLEMIGKLQQWSVISFQLSA
jgi:hypothetical protein